MVLLYSLVSCPPTSAVRELTIAAHRFEESSTGLVLSCRVNASKQLLQVNSTAVKESRTGERELDGLLPEECDTSMKRRLLSEQ
jgi:hypothetical protein